MKKIISLIALIAAIFTTSCSNDDIPMSGETEITINLKSVISNYQEEVSGELESVSSGHRIRVRLFIYNSEGQLEKQYENFADSYNTKLNVTVDLYGREYTAVAITDVVKRNAPYNEFWTLSGQNMLSTFNIEYSSEYISHKMGILGISIEKFKPGTQAITLSPTMMGALINMRTKNIHKHSGIQQIESGYDRQCESFSISNSGEIVYDYASSVSYRCFMIEPSDFSTDNVYSYAFFLPIEDITFEWLILTSNNQVIMGDEMYFSKLEAGHQYYCEIEFDNSSKGFSQTYYEITNSRAGNGVSTDCKMCQPVMCGKSIMVGAMANGIKQ